jgi:hypothetical protein
MKLVQMTRDMRPWQKGHDALVPDDVARSLVAAGDAENSRDFPAKPAGGATQSKPAPAKQYKTK